MSSVQSAEHCPVPPPKSDSMPQPDIGLSFLQPSTLSPQFSYYPDTSVNAVDSSSPQAAGAPFFSSKLIPNQDLHLPLDPSQHFPPLQLV